MQIKNSIISIYLLVGAYTDKKELQISTRYLGVGAIVSLGMCIYDSAVLEIHFTEVILRMLPAAVMLLYSRITQEKIGYGDGIMMLILAGMIPARKLWMIWCFAFIFSAVTAIYSLLVKKEGKEKKMAFLPFLWAAHLAVWGLNYV